MTRPGITWKQCRSFDTSQPACTELGLALCIFLRVVRVLFPLFSMILPSNFISACRCASRFWAFYTFHSPLDLVSYIFGAFVHTWYPCKCLDVFVFASVYTSQRFLCLTRPGLHPRWSGLHLSIVSEHRVSFTPFAATRVGVWTTQDSFPFGNS